MAAAEIDLSARTVSGDVAVRAGTLRGLRASTTSGDLKIAGRFSSEGAFAAETVSGDGLVAPVGDVTIEMTTVTGDLNSDVEGRTEGGRGHRSVVIGSHGPVMTFRSLSGDLEDHPSRRDRADRGRGQCGGDERRDSRTECRRRGARRNVRTGGGTYRPRPGSHGTRHDHGSLDATRSCLGPTCIGPGR